MKRIVNILTLLSILCLVFSAFIGCAFSGDENKPSVSLDSIPTFDGKTPYVSINDGKPSFTDDDMTAKSYEKYAELDSLGRCGVTIACIGKDIMPTEERGSIGSVKPSGWQTVKYDIVDGKYLYNRCHLIGYQLTGENANRQNLITGTRYMNVDGMLPFENMVADYVKETNNHVLYRVTPIFEGTNLVANGVLIEAKSVEDNGEGIEFCVYVYNNQPGIVIDYRNGDSKLDDGTSFPKDEPSETPNENPDGSPEQNPEGCEPEVSTYIINKSSKKVHKEDCRYANDIKEENKEIYTGTLDDLLSDGDFSACGTCKPE